MTSAAVIVRPCAPCAESAAQDSAGDGGPARATGADGDGATTSANAIAYDQAGFLMALPPCEPHSTRAGRGGSGQRACDTLDLAAIGSADAVDSLRAAHHDRHARPAAVIRILDEQRVSMRQLDGFDDRRFVPRDVQQDGRLLRILQREVPCLASVEPRDPEDDFEESPELETGGQIEARRRRLQQFDVAGVMR